ncbi:hypothetical protein F5146DRAFT_1045367, partial [Armillaria mellea]
MRQCSIFLLSTARSRLRAVPATNSVEFLQIRLMIWSMDLTCIPKSSLRRTLFMAPVNSSSERCTVRRESPDCSLVEAHWLNVLASWYYFLHTV